jgi:hypothetical protein
MDKTGESQLNLHDEIFTVRLGADGKPVPYVEKEKEGVSQERKLDAKPEDRCGSCYGAETQSQPCCNTCEGCLFLASLTWPDVKAAYSRKGWSYSGTSQFTQVWSLVNLKFTCASV